MGAPNDGVSDETSVVALGSLIKRRALAMEISYGSGGFCVILRTDSRSAYGYSWDLPDAIQKAIIQLSQDDLKTLIENYLEEDDEPTQPDINIEGLLGRKKEE